MAVVGMLAVALCVLTASVAAAAALSISPAFLMGASKTYGAPTTCTLTAVADASVNAAQATTNFGTNTQLNVSPDSLAIRRTFVRFDLTGCSPTIPPDAIVQTATVRLTTASAVLAARTINLRSVSAAWTEAAVTWNNQPAVAASNTSSADVTLGQAAGTVLSWTATSDIQSFVAGAATDFGFRLSDSAEGTALGVPLVLNAREGASGLPQVVVTYLK
ncbi:MAG: DNRLRE domain-containing protein [Chloroflexota bacterium]